MNHARIEGGAVVEIIPPFSDGEGREVPIEMRFHSDIVATLVEADPSVGIGFVYDGKTFSAPPPEPGPSAEDLRAQRNIQLAQTDWTQLPDVPKETKAKFVPYRAALRDVPQQVGFPSDVKWPTAPQ